MNAVDIREERMNEYFTKYHLAGLPFDAVLHKFIDARDEYFHNHPYSFVSHILKGSYVEDIYEQGTICTIHRKAGTTHYVSANTIHRIIALPEGECWTLIMPEPKVKDSGFYKFENGKVYFRYWWEEEFKIIEKI